MLAVFVKVVVMIMTTLMRDGSAALLLMVGIRFIYRELLQFKRAPEVD